MKLGQRTISKCIARGYTYVPANEVDVDALRKELTISGKYDNKESVPVYDDSIDGLFGLPRYKAGMFDYGEFVDETTDGNPASFEFVGLLRDAQIPVIEQYADSLKDHNSMILESPTGSGKTVMAIRCAQLVGRQTLVIVTKTDLVKQWMDRIVAFTNLTYDDIGLVQQDTCTYKDKPFVIGMIHSLYRRDYGEEFRNSFGLVIFDEVHRLGAYHFSKVAGMFPARRRLGCSATPHRSDEMDDVFIGHLGTHRILPVTVEQPIPKVAFWKYKKSSGDVPSYLRETIQRRGVLLSKLASNKDRTETIAKATKAVAASGRRTLVISERIYQLEDLAHALKRLGIPERDIGMYLGSTLPDERERIANECKIILATSKMLSEGTDIPTLRGLIFATPMISEVTQTVGRIRRICSEEKEPFVVDFVDTEYRETAEWANRRHGIYKKMGCPITFNG